MRLLSSSGEPTADVWCCCVSSRRRIVETIAAGKPQVDGTWGGHSIYLTEAKLLNSPVPDEWFEHHRADWLASDGF